MGEDLGIEGLQLSVKGEKKHLDWGQNRDFRCCSHEPERQETRLNRQNKATPLGPAAAPARPAELGAHEPPPPPPPRVPRVPSAAAQTSQANRGARLATSVLTMAELRGSCGLTGLLELAVIPLPQATRDSLSRIHKTTRMALPARKMAGKELPLRAPALLFKQVAQNRHF